jgi:hypothetical protein
MEQLLTAGTEQGVTLCAAAGGRAGSLTTVTGGAR